MVLIVIATELEWNGVFPAIVPPGLGGLTPLPLAYPAMGMLCGMGPMESGLRVSRALSDGKITDVLNLGICGTYNLAIAPVGTLVHVEKDCLADFGAEDGHGGFLPAASLGWRNPVVPCGNVMVLPKELKEGILPLPRLQGATVSTCSGLRTTAGERAEHCHAVIESMEGAACLMAAELHGIPGFQVRCVTNLAGDRDKQHWKLEPAFRALAAFVGSM